MIKTLIKRILWWLLPVTAGTVAYFIGTVVLRRTPITTDEQSYVFQAWTFIEGMIARPFPPFPEIFKHMMIILDPNVGWLSRYPPGHALWITIGVLLGDPWFIVAIGAGLSTMAIGLAARRAGANEYVAMMLMLASPFFLFTHGTLLSHTSGMLAASLLLFCYVSWISTRSVWWAVLAGVSWAWLFLGRTYTGFLVAIPFGIHALADVYSNRRERQVWTGVFAFAFVAGCGVLLQLTYNWAALGDPLKMTYFYYNPREKLGFGPNHFNHSWKIAWNNFKANGVLMDRWLWGIPFGLVAWGVAACLGWARRWTPLCLGSIAVVWGGYLCFYYPGPHEIGPGYYLETLPFMILAATFGITRLLIKFKQYGNMWRLVAVAIVVALLAADARFSLAAAKNLRREFSERSGLLAFLAKAPPQSLIFVNELELYVDQSAYDHTDYAIFNPRGLGSDPLVVRSLEGQDKAVMQYFSDRKPYDLDSRTGLKLVQKNRLQPYRAEIHGADMHRKTGTNEKDDEYGIDLVRVARPGEHKPDALGFGRHLRAFPCRMAAVFDLKTSGASADEEVAILDVARNDGKTVLVSSTVHGTTSGKIRLEFDVGGYFKIEPRVFYTGTGSVTFIKLTLEEIR